MKKRLAALAAFACVVYSAACAEDLPRLDYLTGQVTTGEAFCHWTAIDPSNADVFDLATGLEMKEAVGVAIDVQGYWLQEPGNPDSRAVLEGILTAESAAPDVVEVFSAPSSGFALLAHKPGTATLTFASAGHPGTFAATVTVIPNDQFVGTNGTPPHSDAGASSSSSGGSSSGGGDAATPNDAGTDASNDDGGIDG